MNANGKLTNGWPGFVHYLVSFLELLFVVVILHHVNLYSYLFYSLKYSWPL